MQVLGVAQTASASAWEYYLKKAPQASNATSAKEQVGQMDLTVAGGAVTVAGIKENDWSRVSEAVNSDGTKVTVTDLRSESEGQYRLQLDTGTGGTIDLEFSGDLRLGTDVDGNYLVFSAETGRTTRYNADGSVAEETYGDATSTAGNRIHIGTTGAALVGSDDDELFFVLGDDTKVTCGSGNDTVVLAKNSFGADINIGEGNNTVTGNRMFNGRVVAGDGDNRFELGFCDSDVIAGDGNNTVKGSVVDGSFTAGDGNNFFKGNITASSVKFGNGDNIIDSYSVEYNSALEIGNGNNIVTVGTLGSGGSLVGYLSFNGVDTSSFSIGNGNNIVDIENIMPIDSHNISSGSRYNELKTKDNYDELISGLNNNSKIKIKDIGINNIYFGNGDNSIKIGNISNCSVNIGNGNNNIEIYELIEISLAIGHGNNNYYTYSIQDSEISFGDGNNAFTFADIGGSSQITSGDGNNIVSLGNMSGTSTASLGSGDNYVRIYTMQDDAGVFMGDGNNAVSISQARGNAQITVGDGSNDISIYELFDNALFSLGDGNNTVEAYWLHGDAVLQIGNGNNIMVTSITDSPSNIALGNGNNYVCNYQELGLNGHALQGSEIERYNQLAEYFDSIREERSNSGHPSINNMKEMFRDSQQKPILQSSELMQRVAMLTSWN